jgi:exodeoxyribonuclease-3
VRLLSYNIRFGGTGREALLADVLRGVDADVVLLQEASSPQVIARLAESARYPWWGTRAGNSTAFLSRVPVQGHRWTRPSIAQHAVLEVTLDLPSPDAPAEPVRLYGLHLTAWFSKWRERRRLQEIRAMLQAVHRAPGALHLIAGDFNALAPGERLDPSHMPRWIQAMIWLSGRDIARTTIQAMLDAGYVDAWPSLRPGVDRGVGVTFPTWDPHVRLDYFFVPTAFAARVTRCDVVTAEKGVKEASDHYPLVAEVRVESGD